MCEEKKFRIVVVGLPDRKNLVAEIFYKGEQWVEISHETGELIVQFYSPNNSDFWEFPLNEALEVLETAKKKLLAVG